MLLYYAAVVILGLMVGSFLNVCIYRIPEGISIIYPPSRCSTCGHRLGPIDLVPVLSYVSLRGRCRYCGGSVSIQYPVVEFVTGLLFMLVAVKLGISWAALAGMVFTGVLIVATVIDLQHQIIPNRIVLFGIIVGIPLMALQSWEVLKSGLIAGLGAGLFLLLVAIVGEWVFKKEAMGGGDIKLVAMMGLFLGIRLIVIGLFMAFLAGGLIGGILMIIGKKGGRDLIPFGPYLALGGYLALLWGNQIAAWYLGLL